MAVSDVRGADSGEPTGRPRRTPLYASRTCHPLVPHRGPGTISPGAGMTLQRSYQVETHRHGKGRWERRPRTFPSKIQAEAWSRLRGYLPRDEAVNGARQTVFRIVPAEVTSTSAE